MKKFERITSYKIIIPGMKSGFTLAEVLITLTIIGVIAALTIPALITNIQDAQLRTAWKSAASIVSQATRKLTIDNGGSLNGVFNNSNDARDKLSAYLSYTQKCDAGSAVGSSGCWSSSTYNFSGTNFNYWNISGYSRIVLNNGIFAIFNDVSSNCTYSNAARHNGCVQVGVDVNGFRGPNTVGKDVFWGYITEDGNFEPLGKSGDLWNLSSALYGCNLNLDSNAYGFTCAALYLQQ